MALHVGVAPRQRPQTDPLLGLFILALDGKAFTKSKSTLFPPWSVSWPDVKRSAVLDVQSDKKQEAEASRSANGRFASVTWKQTGCDWCSKKPYPVTV